MAIARGRAFSIGRILQSNGIFESRAARNRRTPRPPGRRPDHPGCQYRQGYIRPRILSRVLQRQSLAIKLKHVSRPWADDSQPNKKQALFQGKLLQLLCVGFLEFENRSPSRQFLVNRLSHYVMPLLICVGSRILRKVAGQVGLFASKH